jgi:hypothetical protein
MIRKYAYPLPSHVFSKRANKRNTTLIAPTLATAPRTTKEHTRAAPRTADRHPQWTQKLCNGSSLRGLRGRGLVASGSCSGTTSADPAQCQLLRPGLICAASCSASGLEGIQGDQNLIFHAHQFWSSPTMAGAQPSYYG